MSRRSHDGALTSVETSTVQPSQHYLGAQLKYFQERIDPETEIVRPRGYPRVVQFLLRFKLSSAMALAGDRKFSHALVVCCGSGMDAEFLEGLGVEVVGLDLSRAALQRAQERKRRFGAAFHVVEGLAEALPFPDRSFPLVFVTDGLHHLEDPYPAFKELARVSSDTVIVGEPADAPLTRLAVALRISSDWEDAGNYVFRFRRAELSRLFRSLGFTDCRARHDLIYYQPWTFKLYRLFGWGPAYMLFRLLYAFTNRLVGRWGNSLKFAASRRPEP